MWAWAIRAPLGSTRRCCAVRELVASSILDENLDEKSLNFEKKRQKIGACGGPASGGACGGPLGPPPQTPFTLAMPRDLSRSLSLKCRRGAGGSSSPFRHRSAVLRPMAAAPMAQLARPGRLHVQAGRGGHCWVIVSRLNTVFWPTQKIL